MNRALGLAFALGLLGVNARAATDVAGGAAGGASTGASGVDFSRFSALYNRSRSLEETVQRLEKMEDLRRSAQESLERLMGSSAGSGAGSAAKQNIELELRYGELIVQRGRDLDLLSLEVGVAGDLKRSTELRNRSREFLQRGLKLHRGLLARVKNHPMASRVYLGMARTEYGLNQKAAALNDADAGAHVHKATGAKDEILLQLHLLRADAAFDLARAPLALEAYSKAQALVTSGSLEEAYVDYKLGWVHYNLKDSPTALAQFEHLFKISGDRFALQNEAVQDFALFAADLDPAGLRKRDGFKGIHAYLRQQSDQRSANKAVVRMANTLAKNGRRAEGVQAMEFLISEEPVAAENVDYALTIVEWSQKLADKKALTDRYFWLISQFGPSSGWFAAQKARSEIQRGSQEKIEESVRKYSLELHRLSTQETSDDLRRSREDVVAKLYDEHIANFSRENDVPRAASARIHYYRAEIHRRREEYVAAGQRYDSYLRLVALVPKEQVDKIDTKLRTDAIWSAVETWSSAIEKDATQVPRMLAAADRFLRDSPKDPRAAQVQLDAARVELKSGNGPVAMTRLDQLVSAFPKTTQAAEGVNAELDILNKESDWVNLAQLARKRMDKIDVWAPAKERAKLHAELHKILSQTEAKACDALSQQKDRNIEAALCFEAYAKGFENDEQAPKALLRAADLYDGLKDPSAAVGALEHLVKRYPKSEYAAQGFSRLAAVYEKAFEFEKAVGIYETLLEKNPKLPEREKVVGRLLTLLNGLGMDQKFSAWLERKDTPESLRRELRAKQAERDMTQFRAHEAVSGFAGRGPASVPGGRDFFADLERGHAKGNLSLEQELEYRRIRGKMYLADNKLDKADQEWMAGLKEFWRTKERSSGAWEGAARLRLEQASIWEVAYRGVDVMKNPTRKAELYKKLEAWYTEVIEMKAPVVALEALWKSAELNTSFADELRQAPVPEELLAKGMESQRAAYEKLILERTEPMKKQALLIVQQIAVKAREWKVLSPVVLASFKIVANLRAGVELPGKVVQVAEDQVLNFPWADLPRWMDLNAEQLAWSEWKLGDEDLNKQLKQNEKRSAARRAAFVLLSRRNSLSDRDIAGWAKTFTDRAGVQLRVQALLDDHDTERAKLFLEQYEGFFGADAFSEHHWGRLEWARQNYSTAYLRWVRPQVAASGQDFRSLYWSEGWGALLNSLVDGKAAGSSDVFARLSPRVGAGPQDNWQQIYLAKLCLDRATACKGNFADNKILGVLTNETVGPLSFRFSDARSAWQVQREALVAYLNVGVSRASRLEDIEDLRRALSSLYRLHAFTDDAKAHLVDYWTLRSRVDAKQEILDHENKQKILVGVAANG